MSQFSSDVFARVMRLVVPIRREFGKGIDVQNFLHDLSYAKEVLDLAISSRNEKVKEGAEYLRQVVLGPHELGLPPIEQRSTVGTQSKGLLGIGKAAASSPGATISSSNVSVEETRLRAKQLLGECATGAR